MNYAQNILETIGDTPLVKLNTITAEIPSLVLAKVESFNPGNSVKDRIAVNMIQTAEASGLLKPGGTIVEGTSGNTGMGLALAAIVKGYKMVCVLSDKHTCHLGRGHQVLSSGTQMVLPRLWPGGLEHGCCQVWSRGRHQTEKED